MSAHPISSRGIANVNDMPLDFLQFVIFGAEQSVLLEQSLNAVLEGFASAGLRETGGSVLSLATETSLKDILEAEQSTRLVVFYNRAESALAWGAEQKKPPLEALEQWQQMARGVLGVYRKHRRRMILVDIAAFCQDPQVFLPALAEYLKIDLPENIEPPVCETPLNPVWQVIARQAVLQSRQASRLNGELAAGSLPLAAGDVWGVLDVNAAFDQHWELNKANRTLEDKLAKAYAANTKHESLLQRAHEEQATLRLHLAEIQSVLEQNWEKLQKLEAAKKEAILNVGTLKGMQESLERDLAEQTERATRLEQTARLSEQLQREKELQKTQLIAVQSELETHYLDAMSLRKTREDLEKRLSALEGELVSASARAEDMATKLQAKKEELQQVVVDLVARDDSLAEATRQIEHLQDRLRQSEDELRQVLESNAWKVTGPLRHAKDNLLKRRRGGS